jgi:predicted nucleic acid-binding protein
VIVVDASVVVDYLLIAQAEIELAELVNSEDLLVAPQSIDLEILNALRRASHQGRPARNAATAAFANFGQLRIFRYPLSPLLQRIWKLRDSITAYDAAYVALAELLAMPLYTRDRRLARSHGHSARIILI